jgi:hypothetical protein
LNQQRNQYIINFLKWYDENQIVNFNLDRKKLFLDIGWNQTNNNNTNNNNTNNNSNNDYNTESIKESKKNIDFNLDSLPHEKKSFLIVKMMVFRCIVENIIKAKNSQFRKTHGSPAEFEYILRPFEAFALFPRNKKSYSSSNNFTTIGNKLRNFTEYFILNRNKIDYNQAKMEKYKNDVLLFYISFYTNIFGPCNLNENVIPTIIKLQLTLTQVQNNLINIITGINILDEIADYVKNKRTEQKYRGYQRV